MKGSNDTNDIVPVAILYFYPTDEESKKQRLLDCSGMVGIIQYFKHDLFNSVARTFYFRKAYIAHEHYGRHSAFLCVPDDRYTAEEARFYLDQILDIFNMLYGTWNQVQSMHESEDAIKNFLNRSLTPIINYVLSQYRTFANLFSTIDYTPLKSGYQRVLLDVKHILSNLKSNFAIQGGFMGYDDKILYSTCDSNTTFYLQLLFQLKNGISENLVPIQWESDLRNGVSLYYIYIPEPKITTPQTQIRMTKPMEFSTRDRSSSNSKTKPINIIVDVAQPSDDSLPASSIPKIQPHRLSVPTIPFNRKHPSLVVFQDQYGSSEEAGFDTDTADEGISSPKKFGSQGTSSSQSENERDTRGFTTEESDSETSLNAEDQPPITDDIKQELKEKKTSRSSTIDDKRDFDVTIGNSYEQINNDGPLKRIILEPVQSVDLSDDDEPFPSLTRERSQTATTLSDPPTLTLKNEVRVSWKDIPDSNTEDHRQCMILYVQKNSKMTFAGIVQQDQLTNNYLADLWYLILSKTAEIEADIQVISTANESIRLTTDVKFNFNEDTHLTKFERVFDGVRYSRRIPSEESTSMTFFARNQLNRNRQRTVIGLFRGTHFVSIDRTLPDRLKCSCGRSQETL